MQKPALLFTLCLLYVLVGCNQPAQNQSATTPTGDTKEVVGQSGVKDETSSPNVVQIAVGSKDHSTLVTALKAAS
ncbi:MAG: fasciclin domain-containing protein, partial [Saprospiraceae bacterium]